MSWYVDGGPDVIVSDGDIRALADEAGCAGDTAQAALCAIALGEAASTDDYDQVNARWACAQVILDERMACQEEDQAVCAAWSEELPRRPWNLPSSPAGAGVLLVLEPWNETRYGDVVRGA